MFAVSLAVIFLLSLFLLVFVVKSDRGAKEPLIGLALAFGFGAMAFGLALLLEKKLINQATITQLSSNTLAGLSLLRVSLLIGAIEETVKFLPLALFINTRRYFNEHNDGLIYFAVGGVAFGLIENLVYLHSSGPHIALARAGLLLFFHPAASAVVGYFLVQHHLDRLPLRYSGLALVTVAILHGLYNFGVSSGSLVWLSISMMITAGLNASLFLFYRRATEFDQAKGLAASGKNDFCRHCGAPNPKHYLFCEHCGRYT